MFLICFTGNGLFAQPIYSPVVKEYDITGSISQDIRNTGTDYWLYNGCPIQVSVWDGNAPGFGWRAGGGSNGTGGQTGTISFGEINFECGGLVLSDPDVVLGMNDGKLIAKVVGIDLDNFVRTINFVWDDNTNKFSPEPSCPCRYGAAWPAATGTLASGFSKGRKCSFPNIDANQNGDVAITWTETEIYMVEATLGFPFPQPTSSFFELKRGNVLGAYGRIEENCLNCSGQSRFVNFWNGSPILNPYNFIVNNTHPGFTVIGDVSSNPDFLVEYTFPIGWFSSSDVAISEDEDGKSFLSFVFYDYHYAGGGNPLHVTQFVGGKDCPVWSRDWNSFYNYPSGTPRIAAPTLNNKGSKDFHVVLGYSGSIYDCENHTTTFQSKIGILGVYNGNEMLGGNTVNILSSPDITDRINLAPVISYRLASDPQLREVLVVSWTSIGLDNTDRGEIIAAQFKPSDASSTGNGYSIVNEITFGNQAVSSVAARRAEGKTVAYNWADQTALLVEIKQSPERAGSQALNGIIECEAYPRPGKENQHGIILFPNPTNQNFVVQGSKLKEIQFVSCQVFNTLGKSIPVNFNLVSREVNFAYKPTPGVYQIKLVGQDGFNYQAQVEIHP